MIFQNAFDHVLAPVDEYQMQALRNAVLCGVMAFAFIIVGVNHLLTLLAYLFAVAFACVTAWLYSLSPDVRRQVLARIRDVVRMFWRKCVDETFDQRPDETVSTANRQRRTSSRGNRATTSRTDAASEHTSDVQIGATADNDESERIDLLARDFTGLFDNDR